MTYLLRRPLKITQRLSIVHQKLFTTDDVIDPTDTLLTFPKTTRQIEESLEQKKKRLEYQSKRRGMLENDLILGTFAVKYLNGFDAGATDEYDRLINGPSNDWDLFYWATGVKPIPEEFQSVIMNLLVEHCKNLSEEKKKQASA